MKKKNADKLAEEFSEWMVRVCTAVDNSYLDRMGRKWVPQPDLLAELRRRMSKKIMEMDNE